MGFAKISRALCTAWALLAGAPPAHALVGVTHEAPQLAAHVVTILSREGSRAGFCSGVVVGPSSILTAAHCVRGAADTRVLIKAADGAPILLPVATIARHPEYRANAVAARQRSVDLAVVVLDAALPASFTPVTIAAGPDQTGAHFTLAGVGLTQEGQERSAGTLREGDVALRAPLSTLLLWLAGDAGACTGDSGGAVFATEGAAPVGSLVGIIAFAQGSGATHCGALTQAVRVAPFAAWIASVAMR